MQPPRRGPGQQGPYQRVPLEKNNQRAAPRQTLRIAPKENWLRVKHRIRRGHVALVLAVVVVFGGFMAISDAKVRALTIELDETKDLVLDAYNGVREKERKLQFSETDEFIDQQARMRFGYIGENEIRFVVDESISNIQITTGTGGQ